MEIIMADKSNALMHHGVKGMKWGVRREKDKWNSSYDQKQRRRDQSVYGNRATNRINRELNRGNTISGARSREANRINVARKTARTASAVGRTVGGAAGAIGGYYISKYATSKLGINDSTTEIAVKSIIASGAASVGRQIGNYGGVSIGMISRGYSPSKYR